MLKTRIFTAALLAPLVVLAVLKLNAAIFALAWGIIILVACWEWTHLAGLNKVPSRFVFMITIVASMAFCWYWPHLMDALSEQFGLTDIFEFSGWIDWLLLPAVIWWLFVSVVMRNASDSLLEIRPPLYLKLLVGGFILVIAWLFLTRLHTFYGWELVLYLVFLIWLADIAAYFAGRAFGKTKLAPHISPGKTIAGLNGALAVAVCYAIVIGLFYDFTATAIADFVLLSVITVMFSICGDLFESLTKRLRGVKDSGVILPGHGGILDRIDSLIAAIPVFYAGLLLIQAQAL